MMRRQFGQVADYYIAPEEWTDTRISAVWRGDEKFVKFVEKFLTKEQLVILKNRPFGKFMELHNIKMSGILVNFMLLSEVQCSETNEMHFNIQDKLVTFTEQSFKKVTGLSITEPPRSFYAKYNKTSGSRLLRRYFGVGDGKRNLEIRDLKNVMSAENVDFEDDLDAVMLAEVYILGRVLLGGRIDKKVLWQHIVYIEDTELFEQFNWGSLCFAELLRCFKSIYKQGSNRHTIDYGVVGFVFGFSVWVWSRFNDYRKQYVDIIGDCREPLMLSYVSKKSPHFNEVKKLLVSEEYTSGKVMVFIALYFSCQLLMWFFFFYFDVIIYYYCCMDFISIAR